MAGVATIGLGCASDGGETSDDVVRVAYQPDRRDYEAFVQAHGDDIVEPNYLPFMLHRLDDDNPEGDPLVFCRWSSGDMPLAVHVQTPAIPEALQDEFTPIPAAAYVEAVDRALAVWESELEGLVAFERVDSAASARLVVRLEAREAPVASDGRRVLGSTEKLAETCLPRGWDPDAERLQVEFDVPELTLYLADGFGLLTPNQVRRLALHELGHALGMRGHSPFPTDLMFPRLDTPPGVDELTLQDVNSFVSLYRLPPGAVFARFDETMPPPEPLIGPPSGAPMLSVSPHVDAHIGFELRTPAGWKRMPTRNGFVASNGPLWDHDASLVVFVYPVATIDAFIERFGKGFLAGTWRRYEQRLVVFGRPALQIAVEDPSGRFAEEFTFIALGDGRVMMLNTRAPVEVADAWRPWFQASLASLEIWSADRPEAQP